MDFYNLVCLHEEARNTKGKEIKSEKVHQLDIWESIKFKLDNYGYTVLETWGYVAGDITFKELCYDLMDNHICKHFGVEELKQLIKSYS